ncbi:MAG: cobalt-zinc-cadmium efflux system outer membrane protein [Phycisphaerales bacterium]|jgi:cobalt-zinc-cadmium efflux system outer membrane protein
MKRIQGWSLAIMAAASGSLAGCSGPLVEDDILERLGRQGIRSPDGGPSRMLGLAAGIAEPLPDRELLLPDLLQLADQVNPALLAARSAVGVAAGLSWQSGMYPNPSIGVRSGEIGLGGDSANTVLSVSQPIVIGNRLRTAVAAADAEEAAKLAAYEVVRREVFGRVAELHSRVLDASAQLRLVDELLEIGERTLLIAETRFEARAVSEPDVIRPRVEVYQLRADRQRLARELAAAERQLGLTLGTGPIGAERLGGRLPTDPAALEDGALRAAVESGHPALVAADREIEAAEAAIDRLHAERTPDLDVTAGFGYSEEGNQGIVELGIGARIPLWDRRQGDLLAARFELMRLRHERVARLNELLARLAEEIGDYNSARDQLLILRDLVVPDAQRAFDQVGEAYRAGRASFIDLIDTQRTLMQSRRTLSELAGRASAANARLAAIVGTELLVPSGERPDGNEPHPTHVAPVGAEEAP